MTVIIFYDSPSEKCDVHSVSKGKLKILSCGSKKGAKNERKRDRERDGEKEREKDKTGDIHLQGIGTT